MAQIQSALMHRSDSSKIGFGEHKTRRKSNSLYLIKLIDGWDSLR